MKFRGCKKGMQKDVKGCEKERICRKGCKKGMQKDVKRKEYVKRRKEYVRVRRNKWKYGKGCKKKEYVKSKEYVKGCKKEERICKRM